MSLSLPSSTALAFELPGITATVVGDPSASQVNTYFMAVTKIVFMHC